MTGSIVRKKPPSAVAFEASTGNKRHGACLDGFGVDPFDFNGNEAKENASFVAQGATIQEPAKVVLEAPVAPIRKCSSFDMNKAPRSAPPPHIVALFLAWFTVALPRLLPTSLLLFGVLRRWKQHKRSLIGVAIGWIAVYLHHVRRVHLRLGGPSSQSLGSPVSALQLRLAHIVQRCPSLTGLYWPTWCAPFSTMQVTLLLCKEFRGRFLQRSCYKRQILRLQDGVCVALDWVKAAACQPQAQLLKEEQHRQLQQPSTCLPLPISRSLQPSALAAKAAAATTVDQTPMSPSLELPDEFAALRPVIVLLHGAFMDSSSVTMSDMARSLASQGFPVVVMNRRGYGGLSVESVTNPDHVPKLCFYGYDEDLECVLENVASRYPDRPVALVGFSCGSGYATRFAANQRLQSAWQTKQASGSGTARRLPQLLCVVAYDGAYDASPEGGPAALMQWPYNWIANWCVKFFYILRHSTALYKAGFGQLASRVLRPSSGLSDTYQDCMRLSGAATTEQFLELTQPHVERINVPSLFVNSRDDPICVWENVEHAFGDIAINPCIAHAEMFCGTHGCKFGFLGFGSQLESMVGEFITASWHEWQAKLRDQPESYPSFDDLRGA